jgi:hypothetical protein
VKYFIGAKDLTGRVIVAAMIEADGFYQALRCAEDLAGAKVGPGNFRLTAINEQIEMHDARFGVRRPGGGVFGGRGTMKKGAGLVICRGVRRAGSLLFCFSWRCRLRTRPSQPKQQFGKTEWANPRAKIDPKTGNGTPWTIVWDKRGNYDFTDQDGKRKHPNAIGVDRSLYPNVDEREVSRVTGLYGSYSAAAMAMLDAQRDEAGRWSAAPLPTAQPLAQNSPSPTPTPASVNTAGNIYYFGSGGGVLTKLGMTARVVASLSCDFAKAMLAETKKQEPA